MTDARFPERWLNDRRLLRLSDDAFRLFVTSLAWSVANKTDGTITEEDLRLISRRGEHESCIAQLEESGLWVPMAQIQRWLIVDFEETQTTSADLALIADARRRARDKKRRQRAASRGTSPGTSLGQDRPGQALRTEGSRQDLSPELFIAPGAEGDGKPAPSQSRKTTEITTAREDLASDDQQIPPEVLLQSPAAGGNARASANGHSRPSTIRRREKLRQQIIAEIGANPGISGVKLLAAVGGNRQTAFQLLGQLTDDGTVVLARDPADKRRISYRLAVAS